MNRPSDFHQNKVSTLASQAVAYRPVRTFLNWLVLACLLPGILAAAVLFLHEYQERLSQLETDNIQTARALIQAVDNQILRAQALAQGLATDGSLAAGDLAQFHKRARRALEQSQLGINVVLTDRNNQQVLNTSKEFGDPLPKAGNAEALRRVLDSGKPSVSDLFIGPVLRRPLIVVEVPVLVDGKIPYALGITVPPEHFYGILSAQRLPPDWVSTITDSSNTIVARSRENDKWLGQKPAEAFLKRVAGSDEGVLEFTMKDGFPVRSHYTHSPVTGWAVVVNVPMKALNAQLIRSLSFMALAVLGLFAIGLALAWFFGNRISRSVTALTTSAEALGRGSAVAIPKVHIREAAEVASAISVAAELLKERAEAVRTKEAELAEAQRVAKLGSWYWNATTDESSASEELCRIYGRDAIPPFKDQNGTMYPAEVWQHLNAAVQEATRTGIGYDLILPALKGNGTPIWINTRSEVVRSRSGEVVGLRGTVQDITERMEAEIALEKERVSHRQILEQQVAERTAELTAANQELEAMTFATSHDLRGPLGRIQSFTTLLERSCRDRLEGDSLTFLDIICQNASRLTVLVDDLLNHARVAQQTLELKSIDISEAVQGIVREKTEETTELKCEIRTSVPPARVLADAYALSQALGNLVENAIKYSSNVPSPLIEIGGEIVGDRFRLWVRDNGIGFKMEYHDKIFVMFRRLHTYTEYTGSGVGLALVKRAAERMGGKVWAESEPGQGAIFFLELQAAT